MKLIDITPISLLARSPWRFFEDVSVGDALIKRGKFLGVVYGRNSIKIDFCYVDRSSGAMYLRSFQKDNPTMVDETKARALLDSRRAVGDRLVVPDDEFNRAQRVYRQSFNEGAGK